MEEHPEVMRQRIEETKAGLTDKIDTLENRFGGTVETVANMVENTVDAVQSVGEIFDIPLQVRRRPWTMVGGSVAVGFLIGRLLDGPQPAAARSSSHSEFEPKPEPSWFTEQFGKLRDLALGALASVVGDMARQSLPHSGRKWVDEQVGHFAGKSEPQPEVRAPVRAESNGGIKPARPDRLSPRL